MHILSFVGMAVMVVAVTKAIPVAVDTNISPETLAKFITLDEMKQFFNETNDYLFNKLPGKTLSEVAENIKEKMTTVKQTIEETEAVKRLTSSLAPVKTWFKEKATTIHEKFSALKNTTFQQMLSHVIEQVTSLDHKIINWIEEHIPKQ